ncbi:MAG TPA: hypothetical protein VLD85_08645 [Anaeromyxobacteraceae bacterium]|nr:hypothetical protein [Anaeromyxobacteraceae bacterium]
MTRLATAAVVGVAVAAGAGAVIATFVVGGRLAEPTVVPDPYQAGLRYDADRAQGVPAPEGAAPRCAISAGRCEAREDGTTVTLEIEPRPVRAMADLTFTVGVRRGAAPVGDAEAEVALSMPGMYMGENRIRLSHRGGGLFRGQGVIVRCPSGRRTWSAEVTLRPREPAAAPVRATFTFELAE